VPVGETQGAVQVTVKVVAFMVAGDMSSLNAALMAELAGTPVVGPGLSVAGLVSSTLGRVVSSVAPVVNVHV
jgi:hypothetical protein